MASTRRRAAPLLVVLRKVATTCSLLTPTSAATSARILCRSPGKMLLSSAETITLYSTEERASLILALGCSSRCGSGLGLGLEIGLGLGFGFGLGLGLGLAP